jgi:hypothetical protein
LKFLLQHPSDHSIMGHIVFLTGNFYKTIYLQMEFFFRINRNPMKRNWSQSQQIARSTMAFKG